MGFTSWPALLYSLVLTIGAIENVFILLGIYRDNRLHRNLNIVLVAGQALTDLTAAVLMAPLFLAVLAHGDLEPGTLCSAVGFSVHFSVAATIGSLALLTRERHLMLVASYRRKAPLSRQAARNLYVLVWIVSVAYASLPLVGVSTYVPSPGQEACYARPQFDVFALCTLLLLWGGTFFIIYSYVRMWRLARRTLRHSINCCLLIGGSLPGKASAAADQRIAGIRSELFLARKMGIVVVAFLICWTMPGVSFFRGVFGHGSPPVLADRIGLLLALTNSAVNPLLYGFLNPRIREAVLAVLPFSSPSHLSQSSQDEAARGSYVALPDRVSS